MIENIPLNVSIRLIRQLSDKLPWVSLHDIDEIEFHNRHFRVLGTQIDSDIIGLFLSIMYYNNVMNSRSESSVMADYMGLSDKYSFYCAGSKFYHALYECPYIISVLLDADYEDRVSVRNIKSDMVSMC